jgi:hypothetical protein
LQWWVRLARRAPTSSAGNRIETLRYHGAPISPSLEKLLRSIGWDGTLSPLIFMIA